MTGHGSLRRSIGFGLTGVAGAVSILTAAPAMAQAPTARVYTPADMAASAPQTALEMLNLVPGFVIAEQEFARGLGQASGNVLVNGRRIAAKSTSAAEELGRVPIRNVTRIEIVDAASLDVPGLSGQVANVIVSAAAASGQFTWEPEVRAYYAAPSLGRGEVSLTGRLGAAEYLLTVENRAYRGAAGGLTRVFRPDGTLIELRDEVWRDSGERPRISGRMLYEGGGVAASASASYEKTVSSFLEKGRRYGPGLVDRNRRITTDETSHEYELGGDLEFGVGPGRLKFIGLVRGQHEPSASESRTVFADGAAALGDRAELQREEREQVVRAEYRLSNGAGDWQLSGERAFNSLDQATRLFVLQAAGAPTEVPIPNGGARVEEGRSEVMASYGRSLGPRLAVQISAGGEHSSLAQVSVGGQTRSFWRPKGLATAAWKAAVGWDVNFRLERRVDQLDFGNFLASVDLNDDRRTAGNAELVPPQRWIVEAEMVRSLGRYGNTRLKLYGQRIDDIVDTIPIGPSGQSPGNIDHARMVGLDWNSTLELAAFGWAGAKLDARVNLENSRVRDPLTGRPRPISGALIRDLSLELRHDVPGTNWAWGAEVSHWFGARIYRLTEVLRGGDRPAWTSVYLENKDVLGLFVRATVDAGARNLRSRTVFVGRRTDPAAYIERRDHLIGPIVTIQIRGSF